MCIEGLTNRSRKGGCHGDRHEEGFGEIHPESEEYYCLKGDWMRKCGKER